MNTHQPKVSFGTFSGRVRNVFNMVVRVQVSNNRHQRQMLKFQRVIRTSRLCVNQCSRPAPLRFIGDARHSNVIGARRHLETQRQVRRKYHNLRATVLVPTRREGSVPPVRNRATLFVDLRVPLSARQLHTITLVIGILPAVRTKWNTSGNSNSRAYIRRAPSHRPRHLNIQRNRLVTFPVQRMITTRRRQAQLLGCLALILRHTFNGRGPPVHARPMYFLSVINRARTAQTVNVSSSTVLTLLNRLSSERYNCHAGTGPPGYGASKT